MVACLAVTCGAEPPAASDYERVIAGRAEKIVATLDGVSAEAGNRVREAVIDFSRTVNAWHETHGARRRELKSRQDDEARADLAALEAELAKARDGFVARLSVDLSPDEVAKVKDGLTYNVLHVTERAYREMIDRLTDEQQARIHDWLVEARDLAISEGSSDAKHGVFGKYKGRINNFLSQQGYDLKQEERNWQARRKAAAAGTDTSTKESK
jgi:hypothetical protein